MNRKIAYIASTFPAFSETFVQREVSKLIESDYDVTIYSLKTPKNIDSEININELNFLDNIVYSMIMSTSVMKSIVRALSIFGLPLIISIVDVIWRLRRSPSELAKFILILPKLVHYLVKIHESGVDHVHAHWANMPTTLAYMCSICLDDISYSFTGHAWDIHSDHIDKKFLDEKIDKANYVVTCTNFNKNHLQDLKSGKTPIYVNYHGVVPEDYENKRKSGNQTYFVAGGRFVKKKGFQNLVQALGIIKRDYGYEIPVILFGSGPQEEEIKRLRKSDQLETLDLTGKIPHEEVRGILSNAQAFVAPSIIPSDNNIDGIPNVVLEAFASSTPVIGSEMSGIPEVVKDNETGWLVEPGNVDELAEILVEAWESPEICKELGSNGRRRVENEFDIRQNIVDFVSIMEEELDK